jgi:hypothetical protein
MTTEQMRTAVADAGKINKHLKPFNDEVRRLMKDDEERFNRWVSRDAKLQNAILSSLDKALTPQVRGCATANAIYRILKTLTTPATIAIPRAPGTLLLTSAPTPASLYVTT